MPLAQLTADQDTELNFALVPYRARVIARAGYLHRMRDGPRGPRRHPCPAGPAPSDPRRRVAQSPSQAPASQRRHLAVHSGPAPARLRCSVGTRARQTIRIPAAAGGTTAADRSAQTYRHEAPEQANQDAPDKTQPVFPHVE